MHHGRRTLPEPAFEAEMIMEKNAKRRVEKSSTRKVLSLPPGKKSVVLGITGSIAAYKATELSSLLVKQGHEVFVVMTQDATEFISALTLQTLSKNPVMTSFYDEKENGPRAHIAHERRRNLHRNAPPASHLNAEVAHGLAGPPLAAIALATRA